jgi:hypothetical protein
MTATPVSYIRGTEQQNTVQDGISTVLELQTKAESPECSVATQIFQVVQYQKGERCTCG